MIDLTPMYEGVKAARRTVVHLTPGTIACLDEAVLDGERDVSLRWHTIDTAAPDSQGSFTVRNDPAKLVARVVRLDAEVLSLARKEHEYREPYHLDRLGNPLEQRRESYVEATWRASSCRLLTLFATARQDEALGPWERAGPGFAIDAPAGRAEVTADDGRLAVRDGRTGREWNIALPSAIG